MTKHLLRKFTRQILRGVEALGFHHDVRSSVLRAEQQRAMEKQTGRRIGELALLGIEADASEEQRKLHGTLIRETIALVNVFDSTPPKGSSKTALSNKQ